jgi:hypothetical protein
MIAKTGRGSSRARKAEAKPTCTTAAFGNSSEADRRS